MSLLDTTVIQNPHWLPSGQQMAPELSRLYCHPALDRSDHPEDRKAPAWSPNRTWQEPPRKATIVPDKTLSSLAQLGLYRLHCSHVFVALIDGFDTHIIAEESTLSIDKTNRRSLVGTSTLGFEWDTGRTLKPSHVAIDGPHRIVHDLAAEGRLRGHPFVKQCPHVRFYAEVPLYSSSGDILGSYCIGDKSPRTQFEESEVQDLKNVAESIANHLENVWAARKNRKSDRLLNGLLGFASSQAEIRHSRRQSRKDHLTELVSPISSEVPELDRLSVSTKSTRDMSPRPQFQETAYELPMDDSPLFKNHTSEATIPPLREKKEKHQQHARKCSNESNHFVSVSEDPSRRASALFSRASATLQECMDLGGALFLDAARTNSRSFSTVSASDWDEDAESVTSAQSPGLSSSHGAWSERLCEPLGYALSEPSIENHSRMFRLAITEGLLHDMFSAFPQGKIIHPHQSKSGRRASHQGKIFHGSLASRLSHDFPDARSMIFVPLWNWDKSRWMAGTLIWTCEGQRSLGPEDLAFLRVFGESVVSEFSRRDWNATEKSKTDLLASVSHELRSPLHGMLASAELLQTTSLEPSQQDMVTMVETCGLTLLDTMNHLLDFTKINNLTHLRRHSGAERDAADLDNLVSEFELDSLVEDVTESLYAGHRNLVNASKIAGRYLPSGTGVGNRSETLSKKPNSPGDLSVVVRIDDLDSWTISSVSGGWRRVVMNILGNAFKFTRSGYIEVCLSKETERTGDGKRFFAHLSIKDTGCGISPDFLRNNLYKPFAQENVLTEGVGLGLSIVQQLVTRLGGTIDVKSDVGVGTQVDVHIPVEFTMSNEIHPVTRDSGARNVPGSRTVTRVSLVGLNAYADLKSAPNGMLSAEAKRKMSIRGALSNVILSQPGWMLSFADSFKGASGDIGVIEESTLKKMAEQGSIKPNFRTIIVLGEHGISLPESFSIENADVIYIPQPLGPRKVTEALQRYLDTHQEPSYAEPSPISGPFPGIAFRGRSLSGAFALAKGIESPPVVKENVSEFAPQTSQTATHQDLKVLIVDDNDINIKILATFMRKIGCRYETASNGLEALEKYKASQEHFDYVLMDISMPVMDGIVSSSKIREYEEHYDIPRAAIMAVTGVASSTMQEQAFAAGIDDYLVKPLSLHDLKRIMNIA